VKPWAKRIQLFLGEKKKLFFHFWSKRGRGQKEEGHFWTKRVPPMKTASKVKIKTFNILFLMQFFTTVLNDFIIYYY
jgi:hypothetical protein